VREVTQEFLGRSVKRREGVDIADGQRIRERTGVKRVRRDIIIQAFLCHRVTCAAHLSVIEFQIRARITVFSCGRWEASVIARSASYTITSQLRKHEG
jgi:hypothetical protein